MIISNGGVERVLGPHLQKVYKSNPVERKTLVQNADSVVISNEARLMQMARQAIRELPDVREERVAEVQQALSSGEYGPSNDEVATGIMTKGWV